MTARKVHSFRADHDVEEILGNLDKYTKSEHINKAIRNHQKLEAIKVLVTKWREEMKEYSNTIEGQFANVAVALCSDELNDILEGSD